MSIFKKKKKKNKTKTPRRQWKIRRKCLNLIFESAKSSYPYEFGGLLRVDPDSKDIIEEVVILPGTISGNSHAIFKMHMLPIDFTIVGTVHSHPSHSFYPSKTDFHLFQKHGKVHLVVAKPYNMSSWKAYDHTGDELKLEII